MFRSSRGAVNAAVFSRTWSAARAAVGLPDRWGIHGLRHDYTTVLIHAGASVKTVQLALGHSTQTVTLDCTGALVDGAFGQDRTAATPARSRA